MLRIAVSIIGGMDLRWSFRSVPLLFPALLSLPWKNRPVVVVVVVWWLEINNDGIGT